MKAPQKPQVRGVFSPVSVAIECVFFMKTTRPVDPYQLVRAICRDAQQCPSPKDRKCKYIDRLTPVVDTEKASEKGVLRVARKVLASYFSLTDEEKEEGDGEVQKPVEGSNGAEEVNETEQVKETEKVNETAEAVVPEADSQQGETLSPATVS